MTARCKILYTLKTLFNRETALSTRFTQKYRKVRTLGLVNV